MTRMPATPSGAAAPDAPPAVRPRWPRAGAGQVSLLAGSIMMILGSFLPWVDTPFGNFTGAQGAGLWTFYAGVWGLAGALVPRRGLALAHAAVVGVVGVGLPGWQLARLVSVSASTGSWGAALPSIGLLLVLIGGLFALRAARRLHAGI